MSAWIVSKAHIDVLVQALTDRGISGEVVPNEVGRILWRENHRSVNARYNERSRTPSYTYKKPKEAWTPSELLKEVGCYDYQTCEHAGWEKSRARRWTVALKEALHAEGGFETEWSEGPGVITQTRVSPEYEAAPWGVPNCGHKHASHEGCPIKKGVTA